MFGKKLIVAVVLGIALASAGAANADDNPIDAFFNGLGQIFSGDGGDGFQGQALYPEQVSRYRVVPSQFQRTIVGYNTSERPGTIIIDPRWHYLYLVLSKGQAIRYGIGVGRTGFGWHGVVHVGRKAQWPGWTPPREMVVREAKRGHKLPAYMKGGPGNPLGARALYLYGKGGDTGFRIHGTSEPWTIGLNVSSGCIRLVNPDVIDLFNRARVGAKVIVL